MNQKFKKTFPFLLAFLIPAVCMTAVLYHNSIIPFGSEKAFFYVDMNYQYISYFSYFKQMLAGDVSSSFTFAKLIGGKYKKIVIYNPMHETGFTAKAVQKAEGELGFEFLAHYKHIDLDGDLWEVTEIDKPPVMPADDEAAAAAVNNEGEQPAANGDENEE